MNTSPSPAGAWGASPLRRFDFAAHAFTPGRVGRKNDNPDVEQKNWSIARRVVGYDRYDTQPQVDQLNALYEVNCLYTNHFLPVTKLIRKVREGSRVKRIFDEPQTPYHRVLDSPHVRDEAKAKLRATHANSDSCDHFRKIWWQFVDRLN